MANIITFDVSTSSPPSLDLPKVQKLSSFNEFIPLLPAKYPPVLLLRVLFTLG